MQHPGPPASDEVSSREDGFFIPDLCAPPAVFLAVLLAELVVLLHVLALGPLAAFDWRALGTGSFFVQWNTLLCIALICRLRQRLLPMTPATATAVCLGLVLVVSALSSILVYRFYPLLGPQIGGLSDWVLRNALLALILAATVLRYAYLQQRVAFQQRSELQLRLDALRARIRPHFLFNTLNSIASLIAVQPDLAEQAIEDVAELFRAALSSGDRDSSLREECHLCELYLKIEQLRLGDRLAVEWEIDPALKEVALPALLLQPLVENAVYHGISQLPKGGKVSIRAWREPSVLHVEVQNPLPQGAANRSGGNRMALDNIRQRLDAQYGTAASLTVGARESDYCARISIPLEGRLAL
ncbi:sensor histidine kinase [Congregibacter litoralis]|uniref:Histidine kinase n=1 Tax=Congregibacter litoralis KT71 TaxID=314285 RepID=A4A9F5_9GAMM|nr:histidine kinase [Congregibacter litoralis]EAQ97121.1 Histidine kinase [Congregibacter litoralis KT71]